MTTIAVLRRRSDNLARRGLQTGGDHARPEAPSRHRSKPAAATFNDSLNQQPDLLLPAKRVINRRQGLCAPALIRSESTKSP